MSKFPHGARKSCFSKKRYSTEEFARNGSRIITKLKTKDFR